MRSIKAGVLGAAVLGGIVASRAADPYLVKDINDGVDGSTVPGALGVLGTRLVVAGFNLSGNGTWELSATDGSADGPRFLTELPADRPDSTSTGPGGFSPFGTRLAFTTFNPYRGWELWVTDGTAGGTALAADLLGEIPPGREAPPRPSALTSLGDRLVFINYSLDSASNLEGLAVWGTDGTTAGTARLSRPGEVPPGGFAALGSRAFYAGFDADHGSELWVTDGTAAGTGLFLDFWPGAESAYPLSFTRLGDQLIFGATDPSQGGGAYDLWATDGTPQGTVLVKHINAAPFAPRGFTRPPRFHRLGDRLTFWAFDPEHGIEPWVTDGTDAGTLILADTIAGTAGQSRFDEIQFTPGEDRHFFLAQDEFQNLNLWATDGTPEGTGRPPVDLPASPFGFASAGGRFFFATYGDAQRLQLWATDATGAGLELLQEFAPGADGAFSLLRSNSLENRLFFEVLVNELIDGFLTYRHELWSTDGTAQGTLLLKSMVVFDNFFRPTSPFAEFTVLGERLFFWALEDDLASYALWASDGTLEGTVRARHFAGTANGICGLCGGGATNLHDLIRPFADLGDRVLFYGFDFEHGTALWATDGTEAGTALVKDPDPWPVFVNLNPELTRLGEQLVFSGYDFDHGAEPWITDGSADGTYLLKDIDSSPNRGTSPSSFTSLGDRVVFSASGGEMWVTDGSTEGTRRLPRGDGANPFTYGPFTRLGDRLYFRAFHAAVGHELWSSDGTTDGTTLLKDIWPGPGDSFPEGFTLHTGRIFFGAGEPDHGHELWVTDGTAAGTQLVVDIVPGRESSFVRGLTPLADRLVFSAFAPEHGVELWITDGTQEGTTLLKDLAPGPESSYPGSPAGGLVSLGHRVVFTAARPPHAEGIVERELWATDGTPDGTTLLRDFELAELSPRGLRAVGSRVYFSAGDPEHGSELWTTDGTPEGTTLVNDILPGARGSDPAAFFVALGRLFFAARDAQHGRELWALPLEDAASRFRRGDTNADARTDLSDAVTVLGFLFLGRPARFACDKAADSNDDGRIDVSDAVALLNHLFLGAPAPPAPFEVCGGDPTEDELGCGELGPCA